MNEHKDSAGAVCTGCDDTCEDAKLPHTVGGVQSTGCCAMRFAHGTYVFDDNGDVTQEPVCCAGKDCADATPAGCDAHAPDPAKGHVVELRGPFPKAHPSPEKKAQAIADKLRAISRRDKSGAPLGARVADAALTTIDLDKGEAVAVVTALEKRTNPHNPDAEWHHVAPTATEIAAFAKVLGA